MFIVVCGRAGSVAVGACVGTFPTLDDAKKYAQERCGSDGTAMTIAQVLAIATPAEPVTPKVKFEDVK